MADERAGAQSPESAPPKRGGPQPYPAVDQTDGVHGEARSFAAAPQREGCDPTPVSTAEGRLGPGGDPCEGKP
ncbi:hypothetical protein LJR219_000347 [Phenylobacterium sp. LjRoot219]|uniref:hypothetical protein n=1 Tax=Phenylobacterium sp. LjRoot219 TaxID=3342283 RepID=UPI003ECFF8F4